MEHDAILMIAASESDSNIYYATRFFAPDPFIYIQTPAYKMILVSDLELDRARAQARVDLVLPLRKYEARAKEKGLNSPSQVDILSELLEEHKIKKLLVPGNFGIEYADQLRARGYQLLVKAEPFFEQRLIKSEAEISEIKNTLRATEEVLDEAIEAIRNAEPQNGQLCSKGELLTSERLKKLVNSGLIERGCIAHHTIVSCGKHSIDPHHEGSGALLAEQPIILDLFPRNSTSGYYADITRTVVKGRASPKLKAMFEAVLEAQKLTLNMIKSGIDGELIHTEVLKLFEDRGFQTGELDGRMQGMFHGTGHGVGLDIHELPRISKKSHILRSGHVVTVEPGLYYADAGGVRLEDLVVVREEGCENLTQYPKILEV